MAFWLRRRDLVRAGRTAPGDHGYSGLEQRTRTILSQDQLPFLSGSDPPRHVTERRALSIGKDADAVDPAGQPRHGEHAADHNGDRRENFRRWERRDGGWHRQGKGGPER